MSVPLDAKEFAQLAVRVGLVEDNVAKECLYELDDGPGAPAEQLARMLERKGMLTPFQTGKLLKGELDGFILGGYRLLYKVASGSFGRVFRGADPRSGQTVAVKVLRKRWTEDKRRVEMFEREGRLGLTLVHPNIVQILAVSKDGVTGQYFIVMEFVEGANLRDILSIRKKLDVDEALRIMEECAAGLVAAHAKGLTHRDIKPTNILIGTDKAAKLVDFGLAEISSAAGAAVFTDKRPGKDEDLEIDRTLDYAGLEKLTGQTKGDARSDIYFLGTVLFEMLTGHAILPRTRDQSAMRQRQRYDLDDTVRRLGADYGLPANVISVVAKMMAFEPAARYQTPAAMLEAIKGVRAELAGGGAAASRTASGALTVFVVETNPKLQDVFRDKFKKMGLKVLLSIDPNQALRRYQQQPYHALLVDAGAVGRECIDAYEAVVKEADKMHLDLAGMLILNEEQAGWRQMLKARPGSHVLVRPVTMKQLSGLLRDELGLDPESAEAEATAGG